MKSAAKPKTSKPATNKEFGNVLTVYEVYEAAGGRIVHRSLDLAEANGFCGVWSEVTAPAAVRERRATLSA